MGECLQRFPNFLRRIRTAVAVTRSVFPWASIYSCKQLLLDVVDQIANLLDKVHSLQDYLLEEHGTYHFDELQVKMVKGGRYEYSKNG